MKRLENYTREELINITEEEKALLIEVEAMCNGVEIPEEPKYLTIQDVDEPDMEVYEIEADDLYYRSKEEAEKVVSFLNQTDFGQLDYKYEYGYDKKYFKSSDKLVSAKVYKVYTRDEYAKLGNLLKANKMAKETNDRLRSDYNEAVKGYNNVKAEVQEAIDKAVYEQQRENRYKKAYERYVELANGDKEMAQGFFKETYANIGDEWDFEAIFSEV